MLKPGHKVKTYDGAYAEVLSETEDGQWVKVRYLEDEDDASLAGTEDLVSEAEVEALLGVVHKSIWEDKVTVIVHYIPESEETEGGYEAETITGVPHGVKISVGDHESAQQALDHLISGLQSLGFSGVVAIADATNVGGMRRYEIQV
jgi:hypothetical protein